MDENDNSNLNQEEQNSKAEEGSVIHLSGMYENWFLDYASYVILERAIPNAHDGLKPVQRRILHALKELDDGRFNKVANVIGHTMKYHPHGDAAIGDALVKVGQKELLFDTQGNWGNILTGDSAAAPRYIEVRLSKFGLDVVFNPKTTQWQSSYDGRNKEPVKLPVKFPLLLAQGAEGIAVGLSCKILPHNFNELLDASIKLLKGGKTELFPDFPTGGTADCSKYNDGMRGGRVRVRAKISQLDKKTLVITEIPCETTTESLIDSILSANDKGKIKVKKIEDNTAEHVEILVHLPSGVSPDLTIDGLYAFTYCEKSVSTCACVIDDETPRFLSVSDLLELSVLCTKEFLNQELEIRKEELEEAWHFSSLEKIFIEKRIYRDIEECETWEAVIQAIDKGLNQYKKLFKREITEEDIVKLTEIKIKRISKYDSFKADEHIKGIESQLEEVKQKLSNIVAYTIEYYENIKKKHGKGKERKTELRSFDTIVASKVAVANQKLYIDRDEGFAGTGLKKAEYICECSDIDDILIIKGDGTFFVTKIDAKINVGKDVMYINVFKKNDKRTIYNLIYQDGYKGNIMMKRFAITAITRDKNYDLTNGTKGSKILYLTANPNGEAEVLEINLKPQVRLRKLNFYSDFGQLAIKGRSSKGNILSRNPVRRISLKERGISTLGAIDVWFDDSIKRLNTDGRGTFLGSFSGEDKILVVTSDGNYRFTSFDISNHYDEDNILFIQKYDPEKIITAIYYEHGLKNYYVKRFIPEHTSKRINFIGENEKNQLLIATTFAKPVIEIKFKKTGKNSIERSNEKVELVEFISVKGEKARGNRLSQYDIQNIILLKEEVSEQTDEQKTSNSKKPTQENPEQNMVNKGEEDEKPLKTNEVIFDIKKNNTQTSISFDE